MTDKFLARTLERPERALLLLMLAQLVFWSLAPLLSHSAPPLDVVEMQAHGREHIVATFKHPTLPGIVLEAVRLLTGATGWPAFIVSQLFIVATLAIVFALGRDLMDPRRGLIGAALLTGVYFFSWPTPEFNHNVVQMPLWALTCWALWRATTKGGLVWWIVLGLAGGAGIWGKYSAAILLFVAGLWMLYDAQARAKLLTPGPWIALAVAALVVAPQVLWLIEYDFAPLGYAARRTASVSFIDTIGFLPIQLAHHIPMFVLIWAAGLFGKSMEDAPAAPERRALHFLLLLGLGPALLLTVIGVLGGGGLRSAWGAPMFNLSGLLAVALLSGRVNEARTRRTVIGAGVLIVLVSALYFAHMRYGYLITGKPLRGNWPHAEIGRSIEEEWRSETGGAPLRVVVGDIWTGGLIAMRQRPPAHILINGDYSISPWMSPEQVARDGAVVVWSGSQPPTLAAYAQGLEVRESEFLPPRARANTQSVRIYYAIVPPAAPADSQ